MNTAETIREITKRHLIENNGIAMGQCLSAVGWVGGTVPNLTGHPNLIELSMDDTCSGGLAVGYALAGRRPIFICRYQGFMHFNQAFFTNYAAKSKEMWNIPCPIFIRAIAMEGSIGPVASSSHHGMIIRMPGIQVCAPMTPGEYNHVWQYFMSQDGPLYVSEHRKSFLVDYEMPDVIHHEADIALYPISAARLNAIQAAKILEKENVHCNIVHLMWLKPFVPDYRIIWPLISSKHGGLVIDTDFENGASKCIAYDIMQKADKKVRTIGLDERAAGFAPHLDNLPPSTEKIVQYVRKAIKE